MNENIKRLLFFLVGVTAVFSLILYLNFYHFLLPSLMLMFMIIAIALEIRKLHSNYFRALRQDDRLIITKLAAKKIGLKKERRVALKINNIQEFAELKDISYTGIRLIVNNKFKLESDKYTEVIFYKNNAEVKFQMSIAREREIVSDTRQNKKVFILLFKEEDLERAEKEFQIEKNLIESFVYINTNFINILSPFLFSLLAILQNFGILTDIFTVYLFAFLIYLILLREVFRDDIDDFSRILPSIYINLLTLVYPSFLAHYTIKIFKFENPILVLFFFALVFANDGAAFAGGKIFGNKKSTHPFAISPKKTMIGLIFGFVASILVAIIFYQIPVIKHLGISLQNLMILGACMGILVPLGDLVASALKRSTNSKDSSKQNYFGRGGFLDNMDSLIFTAIVFYYFMDYFIK